MEVETAIGLLTANIIVLSIVIIVLIVVAIVLAIKLNRIASNIQHTTNRVAELSQWFSPVTVFTAVSKVFKSHKKR